jgi:uncharacterized membrane protein YhaH (DUF805 family)
MTPSDTPSSPTAATGMTLSQAVSRCLNQYATFDGRASRPEFWWFALAQLLVVAAASIVGDRLGALVALGLLLPTLAVTARRLHDMGRSGWWQLIYFLPFIGGLLLLWWLSRPSESGANRFGAPSA